MKPGSGCGGDSIGGDRGGGDGDGGRYGNYIADPDRSGCGQWLGDGASGTPEGRGA